MSNEKIYQVAIVGGGPVGLFLACCLQQVDISCIILEKRQEPITHSRSIGIHPVSLELFQKIGLAETFISEGIKVKKGLVYCNDEYVGRLSFQSCPPPFPFILILPQYKTEQLLSSHICGFDNTILKRNSPVTGLVEFDDYLRLTFKQNNQLKEIKARYVVGCDGKNSFVRQAANIPFNGKPYGDTYIMGDFSDNTSFGDAAAIFLCNQGLIESFPLSNSLRRWVVKTNRYRPSVKRQHIEQLLIKRIGHNLSGTKNTMLSSFGVQKKIAETMSRGRIILAGDAAHVISPIGGQGMNLGWLDVGNLSNCFEKLFAEPHRSCRLLKDYSTQRLKIARNAARRAEFNMAMGRKTDTIFFRKMLLKGMLKTPMHNFMARLFTMRGLNRLIF